MTNELTKINGKEVALFGGRDEIREMADRLTVMMPGVTRLDKNEALTVAQIAVAHGLDPFNGEVWGLKGENGKWYGVMIGIKGLRKAARREAARQGSSFWTEIRAVDPKKYAAPDTAVVYECILRDTASVQAYGKAINALTSSGMPYQEAVKVMGPAPSYIGHGIATPDERSKMGIHQRARKRAEADAIKQAYDVNFAGAAVDVDTDESAPVQVASAEDIPEAEYSAVPDYDSVRAYETPEEQQERRTVEENLKQMGF